MARQPLNSPRDLLIWHWNCNGFHFKRAVLQQHIQQAPRPPDVILLQETHSEAPPTLPGYRSHASPPSARAAGKGTSQGVCTFVRKGITFVEHALLSKSAIEHCVVELVTGKKRKESTYIVNIYSNPKHYQQRFRTLMHKTRQLATDNTILLCGDFNASHQDWGYTATNAKGRNLSDEATDAGFHILNDFAAFTRIGTSVHRDTNPDLTLYRPARNGMHARWRNTGQSLGSDHFIVEVLVPLRSAMQAPNTRKHNITDWNAFRTSMESVPTDIEDIEQWTQALRTATETATSEIETDESVANVDSRLAHLIEASQSLRRRWKGQRHNTKLRKKIAKINREIEKHCAVLCRQQWHAVCQEADGQMHKSRTWNLLRYLLDETKSKGTQRHSLARTLHRATKELGEAEVRKRLDARYLPATPPEALPGYAGDENALLDRDIEEWEVRAVLQTINCKSAAGPDNVTNKMLRNLPDSGVTALTRCFNECWRSGRLPRQWKEAKTVLIPKPGKPPHVDNLRPISLTSCVGKVLEHVLLNRWQLYLETAELYPNTLVGFRAKLGTQDAMLLLKHEVVDSPTLDNRAVLGLDLQSAFDRVRHAAILTQVSRLNMGERSFNYIKDFLSNRTTTIHAGDTQLSPKTLGSVGTPQGAVISPILFNLVMIDVANHLARIPDLGHTIYADDITLWVAKGSDGHIEETLQRAIEVVETRLEGTGLVCSPAKSEFLILPHRERKPCASAADNIRLHTRDGTTIPRVQTLRVLGLYLDAHRRNGLTIHKLEAKTTAAIRLIRKISNRHAGMKEANLLRLVQSFVVSHIAYVAAFHNWQAAERRKIAALIHKAYKAALGLYACTRTDKLLELGVHNTLEEIAEAQQTAQLERLTTTRTGRYILQRLGLRPQQQPRQLQSDHAASLPKGTLERLYVHPLPKHMHSEHNKERRLARARALTSTYAADTGASYVDVAAYPGRPNTYVAVAMAATDGAVKSASSFKAQNVKQAEEMAIALAIVDPQTTTVLSDSKSAMLAYATNQVNPNTVKVLCSARTNGLPVALRWFPAHVGPLRLRGGLTNRNEEADSAARELTRRAASTSLASSPDPSGDVEMPDPLTTYGEILEWYRQTRRRRPPPHPNLNREEAVLYRQLQTESLLTPVLAKHLCPGVYESEMCRVCDSARATLSHILWNCRTQPAEAAQGTMPSDITEAMNAKDCSAQIQAVQQAKAALARQRPENATPPGKRE